MLQRITTDAVVLAAKPSMSEGGGGSGIRQRMNDGNKYYVRSSDSIGTLISVRGLVAKEAH